MDLHTIDDLLRPRTRADLPAWRPGDAWLAGGTWLFSEPQPGLNRLIDLSTLGWTPAAVGDAGLSLAATCTLAQLSRLVPPPAWTAAPLVDACCRALVGSFKIWNMATVGGNLCLALPAGPITALVAALDGTCTIWTPDRSERRVSVLDFVLGPGQTDLRPGELLRAIDIPAAALRRRAAMRRMSLTPAGRSAALLIGTRQADGRLALTITASTRRPVRIMLGPGHDAEAFRAVIARDAAGLWYDDVHGAPDWREHVTCLLAEEIRAELAEAARA